MTNGNCMEIYTPDNNLLFRVYFVDAQQNGTNGSEGNHNSQNQGSNNTSFDPMTDSQKRYLFRILSHDKLEGEQAHKKLLELFGVKTLSDISKKEASSMIEQLLEKRN